MERKKATIKKIAELANVSISTVSKVIWDRPEISDETKREIRKIMDELNYRPTRTRNVLNTIACMIWEDDAYPSSFGSILNNAIVQMVFHAGYRLTWIPHSASFDSADNLKDFLRSSGIAGIITVNSSTRTEAFQRSLLSAGIPHVVLLLASRFEGVNWIQLDNEGGGRSALSHLLRLGHRRITVVTIAAKEDEKERATGALQAVRELAGEDVRADVLNIHGESEAARETQLVKLLRSGDRPSALFCTNYMTTLRALKASKDSGISIPDELSIVGFGDYEFSPFLDPPLTAVRLPIAELGRLAVEGILEQIRSPAAAKIHLTLPTELIIRESTVAPVGASHNGAKSS